MRPPPVRDTTSLVGIRITAGNSNRNSTPPGSVLDQRDTGIDGQNGVRLGGDNGALLDLSTTLAAQQGPEEEGASGLSEAEQKQLAELRQADAAVRRHEAAHAAAGGAFAGAPSFTYQQGPDGQRYAVAGEVSIDTAPVDGDPAATIQKLQIVRSAALAPSDPSGQDRAVAAQANATIRQAESELRAQRADELNGETQGATGTEAGTETGPEAGTGAGVENAIGAVAPSGETAAGSGPTGFAAQTQGADQGRGSREIGASAARIIDIAV
ncbi:MAG: putative metalloprotease CJM1_0395 family protein [Proteobacteria bacterium]|nr:putative metalloprotease CJM1_0395 family protein [Pseudomonadota bacterium]